MIDKCIKKLMQHANEWKRNADQHHDSDPAWAKICLNSYVNFRRAADLLREMRDEKEAA